MTLKLNKISGYYEGPPGAFYDVKHDEIFVLEWDGAEIYRRNVGVVGRMYDHHSYKATTRKTAVCGLKHTIYLGDVGYPFRNL